MKQKIERYTDKFIEANFDKKDKSKNPSVKFEWFVNSLHCWEYSSQSYNSKQKIGKEISLGTAQGGDAFFLLIGNKIFSLEDNIEEVIKAIKDNNHKIEFHLIQTKKSTNAKIGDFINFVNIPIKVIKGEGISGYQKELLRLANFISKIKEDPELEASFVLTFYTEKDENDIANLRKDWNSDIEFLKNQYAAFGNVIIHLEGSKKLNELFEQFNSNEYKLIINKDNCRLDKETYLIGFVTARELLDCIAPEKDNNMRVLYPDVFKNNIRLYLGPTEVNEKIETTLSNEPTKFHLYNNGLTITTKDIKPAVENFIVSPVNIVNGCQTANSIYNIFKSNSKNIDLVKVPVKIIIASDDEYEKITIRTNSQNGISEKDLVSITNIQKDLEDVFSKNKFLNSSFTYKRQNSISEGGLGDFDYIVNINDILRAIFSTLLYMPHKVSGYFDKTTSDLIDIIFEDRFIKLYQVTTSVYKILDDYLDEKHPENKKLRFHLLYLFYKFICKDLDIDNIERYFRKEKNKKNFEELDGEELLKQNELINNIVSRHFKISKNETAFHSIIDYLIEIIVKDYSNLTNLDTREKEKILYKTVDKVQRGEQVFSNFELKFTKTLNEFITE